MNNIGFRSLPIICCCLKLVSSISLVSKFTISTSYHRQMASNFPKTLAEFGYGFTENGVMKKIDSVTGTLNEEGFEFETQEHYDALGETITDYVYDLLMQKGLQKIYIPNNVPEDETTFIFATKNAFKKPKKLIVLIHGSGVVRAGQWARSLIINHSLDHGTQIPYIEQAQNLGYDVIIMNTNDNTRIVDNVKRKIGGNSSPTEHAYSVWDKYIIGSNPESVCIVAHSYGGVVTIELVKKYPKFFEDKVFAIGLTDSVHSTASLDKKNIELLKRISRNWITSNESLDEFLRSPDNNIPMYSAGHTKHEWTSYSCRSALFEFFEKKYHEFNIKKLQNTKQEL